MLERESLSEGLKVLAVQASLTLEGFLWRRPNLLLVGVEILMG